MKKKNLIQNRLLCCAFVLLLLPLNAFSAGNSGKTAVQSYEEGLSFMEDEDWYKAGECLLAAVNENPSYAEAWYSLSLCSYMLGEFDLVLVQLENAEKYLKDDTRIDNLRGMTLIALEDFSGAREIFEKVLKTYPNNVEARFGLAELDLFDGKYSGAEREYGEALKRQGKNRKALLSLALVSARLGKYDNARHFMESALSYYSGEAEVHYLSAVIYAMKGDVKEAERHCRVSVSINGNYDRAYELLAKALYEQKKYDEVISICDFRISRNRNLSSAWYLKGQALNALGKTSDAIQTWSKALRITPEDEIMRASLELLVNEFVPIEDPRRTELAMYHVNCAKEASSRFDSSQAAWEYQRALKIQPSNEEARLKYAQMLELKGLHEQYLDQLLFVKSGRAEEATAESTGSGSSGTCSSAASGSLGASGSSGATSSAAGGASGANQASTKKSYKDVLMDDTIEAYDDILSGSLARKWKVEPFYLDKTRWHIGIYYVKSSMHLNHAEGNRTAALFAKDVFTALSTASVDAEVLEVSGFADAYQRARKNGIDYFVMLNQDEGNRDISLEYSFYSGRTGYLLGENTIYGTGNLRHATVFRRFRAEIMGKLPVIGKIIAREGKVLLSDMGLCENIREGAVFDIVRKGAVRPSGTSYGVEYKENDIFGTYTVTTCSEEISEGILEYKGFYDRVNIGDQLVLLRLPPSPEAMAAGREDTPLTEAAPDADVNGESLTKKAGLTAEDLGIRRTPSFMDIIRSIY